MKRAILVVLITAILLGGAVYLLFPTGKPEIPEIKSITNTWGDITPDNSEIITNIVVDNPNAIPIPIKSVEYEIFMNDVKLGSGHSIGEASLPPHGEHTITLLTELENDKIPQWWVTHIRRGENTDVKIKGNIVFDLKITEYKYPIEQTISGVRTKILGDKKSYHVDEASLEPQMRSIENSWGRVAADQTEVRTKMVMYNPQPVPIYIERIRYEIYMNGVRMGSGLSEETILLKPRSDTEISLDTRLDNGKLDDWWVSHLRNGERTSVEIKSELLYKAAGKEFTIELPVQKETMETDILGGG
ncbi:MAG: LEA/WHy family protein [Candidatus Methanospirareceae archaeon]